MKKAALLLIILAALSPVFVKAETIPSRHLHVADGGLVFVTDTVYVSTDREIIRLGYPADIADKIVGYYVLNENGRIVKRGPVSGVVWLEVSPETRWSKTEISVVTVWRNMLVESAQGRYLLVMPANPIRETETEQLSISISIDGTPSITSVTGVNATIAGDKASARGTVTKIPANQFQSFSMFFEAPDLLRFHVEEARIVVDLESSTIRTSLVLVNEGDATLSSVDVVLGKSASFISARSGFTPLTTTWQAETGVLTLNFLQNLQRNERVNFEIIYTSKEAVKVEGEKVTVNPPKLLNASASAYYLTISTGPATQIRYESEPWELKLLENNRRLITFKFSDIYMTSHEKVSLTVSPSLVLPVPTFLLAAIMVLASFLAIKRSTKPQKVVFSGGRQIRKNFESVFDSLLIELDKLKPAEKPHKFPKAVDESIRTMRSYLTELRKMPEASQVYPSLEHAVEEIASVVQALNRSSDDYANGQIPKPVYQRIYREYVKQVRKAVDQANDVLNRLGP